MKSFLCVVLSILIPLVAFPADQPAYKVRYDGGSLGSVKSGADLFLYVDSARVRFVQNKTEVLSIPATSITEVSYGQDVHRRVGTAVAVGVVTLGAGALVALSKSKKHYVGLTWANGDEKGGLAIQCDKKNYRGIIAALEGVSGKKAANSDTMTVKN